MRTYSVVFLDIDGTLLDSRHHVMPCTRNRLQYLHRRGVPIVLCSARPPEGVNQVARQVGVQGPVACYNGGLIFDENSTILRDVGIDIRLAMDFKRFVSEQFPDLVVSGYLYNVWLVEDPRQPEILQEAEISGCMPFQGTLEQVAFAATHVHKLLCIGDAMRIRALQKQVQQQFPQLMALRSKSTYLEILPPESTKGSAARVLLEHYGLEPRQAVAFGDSDVDVDMLQYCGFGVAMGNAPRQVKEAADYVTASNDQEGVYIALNSLSLKAPGGGRSLEKARRAQASL
ncbi:MAG: HAD family phosphatase [Oscillospiraceae bacterium]|nr:HAD family phosphatase [Oscillospiraceae bacterium]MBQ7130889.1 HAD family phosphatase [Oscillospiraceae bacterium]